MSGVLPLDALPRFEWANKQRSYGFARCQLDVSTGGKAQLLVNSTAGLMLWNDGVPVDVHDRIVLDLKPGSHTLTFQIDLNVRKDALRCELDDVPQSPARVQIVNGVMSDPPQRHVSEQPAAEGRVRSTVF